MKEKIHPQYTECAVTCGCGNTFVTRSTKSSLHVEICSNCHPFYTGKQKYVDTAGRVEKFQKRHAWGEGALDKVLLKEKEAPKKTAGREKVIVGTPRLKRRKDEEIEEEEAPTAKGKGPRSRGPRDAEGGAPSGAPGPQAAAAPEGKKPEAKKVEPKKAAESKPEA